MSGRAGRGATTAGGSAISRGVGIAAVGLFAGAAALCHVVYFLHDRRGFVDHDLHYTAPFLSLLEQLRLGDFAGFVRDGVHLDYPLINWLLAAWTWAVGLNFFTYSLLSLFFLLGLVFCAARLAGRRAGPLAGALSALAVATCPLLDNASRKYFVEFHATALVFAANCLALAAVARAEKLTPARLAGIGALLGAGWLTHPAAAVDSAPAAALVLWTILRAPGSAGRRATLAAWLAAPAALPAIWLARLGLPYFLAGAAQVGRAAPDLPAGVAPFAAWARAFFMAGDGPWFWLLPLGLIAFVVNVARAPRAVGVERAFLLGSALLFAALSYRSFARGQGLHFLLWHPLALTFAAIEVVSLAGARPAPPRANRIGAVLALLALTLVGFAGKFSAWSLPPSSADPGVLRFDRRFIVHTPSLAAALATQVAAASPGGVFALQADFAPPADRRADEFMGAKNPCLHLRSALAIHGLTPAAVSPAWRLRAAFGRKIDWSEFVVRETALSVDGGAAAPQLQAGVDERQMPWIGSLRLDPASTPSPAGFACRVEGVDWASSVYWSSAWRITHP